MKKNIDKRLTPKMAAIYLGILKCKKRRRFVLNGGKIPDNEFNILVQVV